MVSPARRGFISLGLAIAAIGGLGVLQSHNSHASSSDPSGGETILRVGPHETDQATVTGPPDIDAFVRGRSSLGLTADIATIRALSADPVAMSRGAQLGFPLTQAELASVASRFAVQVGNDRVLELAPTLAPAAFAGTWFDLREGALFAAYTDDDPSRLVQLQAVSSTPDAIRVTRVRYTLEQLTTAALRIYTERDRASSYGVSIDGTARLEQENRVEVTVENPDPGSLELIAAAYDVDPDMLRVTQSSERVYDGAPLGGHGIQPCSAGAHAFVTGPYGQPAPYLITAGHCPESLKHNNGGNFGNPTHNPTFTTNVEIDNSTLDAQSMNLGNPPWAVTSWVEGWSVPDFRLVSATGLGGTHDQNGAWVCHSGAVTKANGNCGPIYSSFFSQCGVVGWRAADYTSAGGDSGGTVYGFILYVYDVPLVGIHSGRCNGHGVYSHQERVLVLLGLHGWYLG